MFPVTEVFFFFATFLLSITLLKSVFLKRKSNHVYPPSMPSLPIIGSFPFMLSGAKHMPKFFVKKANELGPIFTFKTGSKLCVMLSSFEVIQEALVKKSSTFSGRHIFFLETYGGNERRKGIVAGNGNPQWKLLQKLALSILRELGFGDKCVTERRISLEVTEVVKFIQSRNGKPFDPKELAVATSANVIHQIMFADRYPFENGMSKLSKLSVEFIDNVVLSIEMAPWLRFFPYFKQIAQTSVRINTEVMQILKGCVDEAKAGDTEECFVSKYLEKQGKDCDLEELLYVLRDLVSAGTDTTANTIMFSLLFLANHQDIQKRMQREIDEVVPRSRLPSIEEKRKLPYVEAFILEVLRITSLLPVSIPHQTLHDTEISGYFIQAGTTVMINLYAVHMDPTFWKDPEEFKPERFLDKDNNIINSERCIPFSLGRRSCLGEVLARQELYQILTGLVQNFVTLLPEGQESINEKDVTVRALVKPAAFQVRMKYRV